MLIPYPPLYSPGGIPYPMGHLSTTQFSVQTYGATGTPLAIGTFVSPEPLASEFAAYIPGIIPIGVDFGGVWHLYDFNLYWTNIRQNARDRTNAYFLSQGSHVPFISGPITATVAAGAPLTYQVTTTSPATQFSATGLNGLSIDPATGTITGTPSAQTYAITITATNTSGSATGELALISSDRPFLGRQQRLPSQQHPAPHRAPAPRCAQSSPHHPVSTLTPRSRAARARAASAVANARPWLDASAR